MSGVRMLHFLKIDENSFQSTNTITVYYGFKIETKSKECEERKESGLTI